MDVVGIYEKAYPQTWNWKSTCKHARQDGFGFIEVSIDESNDRISRLFWSSSKMRDFYNTANNQQLKIGTIALSAHRRYPMGSKDKKQRSKGIELGRQAIDFALEVHCPLIQLAGYLDYYNGAGPDSLSYFIENIQSLIEYASGTSLRFAIENVDGDDFYCASQIMHVVRLINSSQLGVYFDVGNVIANGLDIESELNQCANNIFAIQLKETLPNIYRRVSFGSGDVPFKEFGKILNTLGITAPKSIEMWNDGEDPDGPREALEYLRRTGVIKR